MSRSSFTNLFTQAMLVLTLMASHASVQAKAPIIEKRSLSKAGVQANTASANSSQTSTEWQLYQRILVLDEEITQLRDQVERMQGALDKAEKNQKKHQKAINSRLNNQETALIEVVDKLEAQEEQTNAPAQSASAAKTTTQNAPMQTAVSKPVTKPVAKPPVKTASSIKKQLTKPKPVIAVEDKYSKPTDEEVAKKSYLKAYDVFKSKGKRAGVQSMKKFINTYPNSGLIPSAHFWIGEFYLSGSEPDLKSAQRSFETVVNRFPKSSKIPKTLYRLGYIAHLNDKISASKSFMSRILKDYPDTKEAGLAKAFLKRYN